MLIFLLTVHRGNPSKSTCLNITQGSIAQGLEHWSCKFNSLLCGIVLYTYYNLGGHFFTDGLYFIEIQTHPCYIYNVFILRGFYYYKLNIQKYLNLPEFTWFRKEIIRICVKWKWKWSCSVVSNSLQPHGLQPTRLLHPWDFFQARVLEWVAISFSIDRYKCIHIHMCLCILLVEQSVDWLMCYFSTRCLFWLPVVNLRKGKPFWRGSRGNN